MMFRRRLYTRAVQRSLCFHSIALVVGGLGSLLLVWRLVRGAKRTVLRPLPALAANPHNGLDAGAHDAAAHANTYANAYGLPEDAVRAALAGLRILVVDDSAMGREVATGFLEAVGIQVETAQDGLDALACLQQGPYDAVLMDLHMPRMDGIAATRAIRQQPLWAHLPVIALTAQDEFAGTDAALAAGMDGYLTKPMDGGALYHTIADCLRNSRGLGFAAVAAAAIPHTADTALTALLPDLLPVADLRAALVRLGGEYPRLVRLLRGFVRDFADIPAQWRQRPGRVPRDSLALVAHTMKSAALYLGAEGLASAAVRLEALALQADNAALQSAAEAFCVQLEAVLQGVAAVVASGQQDRPALEMPALQNQLALAASMVSQGDYAATGLLAEIAAGLSRTPWLAQAELALLQFEDLDLTAARATLDALALALVRHDGAR